MGTALFDWRDQGARVNYPRRPSGFPIMSSNRHGLTECSGPPHSAQRLAESCERQTNRRGGGGYAMGYSQGATAQ